MNLPENEVVQTQTPEVEPTPVAPAAQAPKADAKVEADAAPEASGEEVEVADGAAEVAPKKAKGGFQRKIDRLEQEMSYWREQAMKGHKPQSAQAEPEARATEAKAPEGKPDPDKFETHSEYVEALTEWKLDQREIAKAEKAERERIESEQKKLYTDYSTKAQEFAKANADYEETLLEVDDIPLSPAVRSAILESGPELAYALAKDRAEYERINRLPPIQAARAIGRIEARLAAEKASPESKVETKKVTAAPKPLAPVGKNSSTKVSKSPEEMSFAEYDAYRREQERKKRGS